MKAYEIYFTVILGLVMTGCATQPGLTVQSQMQETYAPQSLVSAYTKPPQRPYVVIAVIKDQGTVNTSPAQIIAEIEKRAGALGANAVILTNESGRLPAQLSYNPSGGTYTSAPAQMVPKYSAEAIRWIPKPQH
jgi:hypothetical protein